MPLDPYRRGASWWFRGRIDRLPGSRYYRQSTETSDEGAAREIVADFERRELQRHYGGVQQALTFAEAICLYDATAQMARFLEIVLDRSDLGGRPCADITGEEVRDLCPRLYPRAAADTWQRQVIVPVSAVINNAHQLGRCPPLRIKGFSSRERIAQDRRRGKASRQPKQPGSWPWLDAFRAAARELGDERLAVMALFMFLTGRRLGPLVALEPGHLDLQHRRAWLQASKLTPAGWVELPVELVVELANLPPRRPRSRAGRPRHRLKVFGFANHWSVYAPWRRVCAAAGIPEILPHAAGRHGFGTETISRLGIDPASAARAGGWANPVQMLRTYAHPVETPADIHAKIRANRTAGAADRKAEGGEGA